MVLWPDLGTRVTLRYRLPPASVPPLTDAIGHLLAVEPMVRVRTKTGTIVEVSPGDVVALRILTDKPVRTADIRNLEHAAAAAGPAAAQTWLDGWLLRAAHGSDLSTNAAVPLDISAHPKTIPAITAWYLDRGLTPRLAIPDRLLQPPTGLTREHTEQILVRDIAIGDTDPATEVRGELPATVTDAPDGTRWIGLAAAGPDSDALLAWGVSRGATRAYLRVAENDSAARAISLGFRLHHRRRYFLPPST